MGKMSHNKESRPSIEERDPFILAPLCYASVS